MIAPLRPFVLLLFLIGPSFPALATSPRGIGFDHFTATGPNDVLGRGISDLMVTDLVPMLQSPDNKDCNLHVVELKRRAEILKELELQKSPHFDQSKRVVPNFIETTYRVTGHAETTGSGISWTVNVTDTKTGEIVSSHKGSSSNNPDELIEKLKQALQEFVEKLCPRAYHLKTSTGPYFQIETEFCGIDKPFNVRPKGEFAGVAMVFTPQSVSSGTFTQGGKAYGAQWTGGGTYTIDWKGDSGRFVARDSYTAKAGAGKSNNPNDQMTGTVTRLRKACAR
ncbi:MAG: hypothetical protein J0L51_10485 [Rhizobiales bacterium]|nr:hypothetical protein [Hyphomicrobiales bacterium]